MQDFINLIDVKTDNTTDYKETSMLLIFPKCSGKCGKECQNDYLRKVQAKQYKIKDILTLYESMNTHNAIVCAGLEPFDSDFEELKNLFKYFMLSEKSVDFVIYTGYKYEEIEEKVQELEHILNSVIDNAINADKKLVIKFGRYDVRHKEPWKSDILGVELATTNQYVKSYIYYPLDKTVETIVECKVLGD